MASTRIPIGCYGEGPEAKKRWSLIELIVLSTPSPEAIAIALEEEREAEEVAKEWQRLVAKRKKLAKDVLSPRQYSVFLLKMAGREDSEIAEALGITKKAVQTYGYPLKAGQLDVGQVR